MTLRYGQNLGLLSGGDPGEQHYQAILQQWRGLDALVQPSVISRVDALPTSGMLDGDRYLLTAGANANRLARYSTDLSPAGWEWFTPRDGWYVWSTADQAGYRFSGNAWVQDGGLDETVYRRANVIGTVSESSGIPTGAIIETGSNSNGVFIKHTDGSLICRRSGFSITAQANVEYATSWVFPHAFADTEFTFVPSIRGVSVTHSYSISKLVSNSRAVSSAEIRLLASVDQNYVLDLLAVGRWF